MRYSFDVFANVCFISDGSKKVDRKKTKTTGSKEKKMKKRVAKGNRTDFSN